MLEESVANHRPEAQPNVPADEQVNAGPDPQPVTQSGTRPDTRTLVVMVIDLTQGRYRGAVKITQWLDGVVSSRIRHSAHVRNDAVSAQVDAAALALKLEAE